MNGNVRAAMLKSVVFSLIVLSWFGQLRAQHLAFTKPQRILLEALSDKAPSLLSVDHQSVTAWKDTGTVGAIHVSYLAQNRDTVYWQRPYTNKGASSAFAPVLQAGNKQLYLFWVSPQGRVQYVKSTSPAGFAQATVYTLSMSEPFRRGGISVTFTERQCILAGPAREKDRLMLAICDVDEKGILNETNLELVKGARSTETPILTTIEKRSIVRVSWVDRKKNTIYYANYTPANRAWQLPQSIHRAENATAPAFCRTGIKDNLFWIWKGKVTDERLRYLEESAAEMPEEGTVLPDYFSTSHPVSIASPDSSHRLMVYTGTDQRLYFSCGINYNPASWIGDLLLPGRKDYSLKDIVIPGAHDAGMSLLTGVGGRGEKTINECNTLTQIQTIEKQLNAGIRMFDLRIDQKKGEFYMKHAPSDCMEDAIAGGYGEKLSVVLQAVRKFLDAHKNEFVILSFCHFCTKSTLLADQAKTITEGIGNEKLFNANGKKLQDIRLNDLVGKVLVTFEEYNFPDMRIEANSMTEVESKAFMNYRREYAATNQIGKLITAQKDFFTRLDGTARANDLIRLDWQLTEASQEAVFICNDFQTENANPLVDGFILLANTIKKNKSIRELALMGSRYLPGKLMEWIAETTIKKDNKPNILYVDVAGTWITEFCIALNQESIYQK